MVEVSARTSVSFLRYSVRHIYLDGVYLGLMSYRSTEDLVIKLGLSLKATTNPVIHMCHAASLARLGPGNLEAWSQMKTLYDALSLANDGPPTTEQWDNYYDDTRNLPHSVRMVIDEGRRYSFPHYSEIWDKQRKGYSNRSGFSALDQHGSPFDGSNYFFRQGAEPSAFDSTIPMDDDDTDFEHPFANLI